MKKKIYRIVGVAVILTAVMAFNVHLALSSRSQNDILLLANVEALAQNEGEGGGVSCIHYSDHWSGGCLYHCCLGSDGQLYALYIIHCLAR